MRSSNQWHFICSYRQSYRLFNWKRISSRTTTSADQWSNQRLRFNFRDRLNSNWMRILSGTTTSSDYCSNQRLHFNLRYRSDRQSNENLWNNQRLHFRYRPLLSCGLFSILIWISSSRTTNSSTLTNSLTFFIKRRNPSLMSSSYSNLTCSSSWSYNWFVQVNLALTVQACLSLRTIFREILVQ